MIPEKIMFISKGDKKVDEKDFIQNYGLGADSSVTG